MVQPAIARAVAAAAIALLPAAPAEAHGGATGAQEFLQHNLVTAALLLVIVLAAGSLVWLNRPDARDGRSRRPARPARGAPW